MTIRVVGGLQDHLEVHLIRVLLLIAVPAAHGQFLFPQINLDNSRTGRISLGKRRCIFEAGHQFIKVSLHHGFSLTQSYSLAIINSPAGRISVDERNCILQARFQRRFNRSRQAWGSHKKTSPTAVHFFPPAVPGILPSPYESNLQQNAALFLPEPLTAL